MILLLFAAALAALLGFAAHRGSICTVKAVAEVLTSGRAFMLISFVKTVAWVVAIALPIFWWTTAASAIPVGWSLSYQACIGGFVFGIGAAVNGGCAFSTLSRFAEGETRMLGTFFGMTAGAAIFIHTPFDTTYLQQAPAAFWTSAPSGGLIAIMAALWAWCLWEGLRLWRTRDAAASAIWGAGAFRLSSAALFIGLTNGVLFAFVGAWAYTGTIAVSMADLSSSDAQHSPSLAIRWGLFGAVFLGMAVSAHLRKSIRPRMASLSEWAASVTGGAAMGFGVAMAPGGNEYLILQGIPGFSPHSLPAYLALLLGIAAAMAVANILRPSATVIDCTGDYCRAVDKKPT